MSSITTVTQTALYFYSMMYVAISPSYGVKMSQLNEANKNETVEERRQRYIEIATALVEVVYDAKEEPIYPGSYGRAKTGAMLLGIGKYESGWQFDVDRGFKRGSGMDSCIQQIRVGNGKTVEGWTHEDLVTDYKKCFRASLRIARQSFKDCRKEDWYERLSEYASGSCFSEIGKEKSYERVMEGQILWNYGGRYKKDVVIMKELSELMESNPVRLPIISVIVPVLNRPQNVKPLLESYYTFSEGLSKIYFIAGYDDEKEIEAIKETYGEFTGHILLRNRDLPYILLCDKISWPHKINIGFNKTNTPWLLLGADDIRFSKGWESKVLELDDNVHGVVGTNDTNLEITTTTGKGSTHPLISRKYINSQGGTYDEKGKVIHEGYRHYCCDTELCETAKVRGKYLHRFDIVIEHMHPFWNKAKDDDIYKLARQHYNTDRKLFNSRIVKMYESIRRGSSK